MALCCRWIWFKLCQMRLSIEFWRFYTHFTICLIVLVASPICVTNPGAFQCAQDFESRSGDDLLIPQNKLDTGTSLSLFSFFNVKNSEPSSNLQFCHWSSPNCSKSFSIRFLVLGKSKFSLSVFFDNLARRFI